MGNGSAIARLLPDGKQAVSAAGSVLQLVKLDSSTVITNFYGHSDSILALRISPTGRCLATGSLDKTARVWSFDGGRRLRLLRHTDSVEGVAFSPNDELLATATRGILGKGKDRAGMCLWDAVEGRLIYDSPTKSLPHVAILGDNEHAVMSWAEKSFLLWSLSTRPNTAENQDPGNKGKSVLVPAGANRLLLGDGDGDVILWDPNLDAPKAIARAKGDSSGIIDLAASEDGRRFAAVSGKSSGILQVWDDRGREIGKLEVSGPIRSVSMSSNGRYVLIAQRDGSVRLFDVEKMR
jgi:WD40 repeat protein